MRPSDLRIPVGYPDLDAGNGAGMVQADFGDRNLVSARQLLERKTFTMLGDEFQRRYMALIFAAAFEANLRVGVGTGWRSFEAQKANFERNPQQFADPRWSLHVEHDVLGGRGWAIDTVPYDALNWCHRNALRFGLNWLDHMPNERHHCLPLDVTDVLTPDGWVPLVSVIENPSVPVASWSMDSGIISFVPPIDVVIPRDEAVIMLRDGSEATPEHRIPVSGRNGEPWKMTTFAEVDATSGVRKAPVAGHYAGAGVDLTVDELRFLVWVQGDGTLRQSHGVPNGAIQFRLKKDRKIGRLRDLCDRLALDVDMSYSENVHADGATMIAIHRGGWSRRMIEWLDGKSFSWRLLHMDEDQWAAFRDEIPHVDGQFRGDGRSPHYWSTDRQSVDVIQALIHLHGGDATVRTYDRATEWSRSGLLMNLLTVPTTTPSSIPTRRVAGQYPNRRAETVGTRTTAVGCLATVDDTIVIRQRGRVYIVGNCQPVEFPNGGRATVTGAATYWPAATVRITLPYIGARTLLEWLDADENYLTPIDLLAWAGTKKVRVLRGDRGESVRYLQTVLGATADGIFGARTEEAVRAFQTWLGLEVDGIVGKNTWALVDRLAVSLAAQPGGLAGKV